MGKYISSHVLFSTLLMWFISSTAFGQKTTYDARENFLEAESYFLYEEYLDALPLYAKLKDKYLQNFYLDYKIGRCYLNIPYERSKSILYLDRASKHISAKFIKESDWNETEAPLDVLYFLGDAYRINNQLEKAAITYDEFKRKASEKSYDIELVQHQIKSLKTAIGLMNDPLDIDEYNLGEIINTRYSETNPVVSEDGKTLVYASKLPFYQAVFYSKKINGQWSSPINMLPELGIDGDCFPTSISPDGTELYVYRSNEFQGDIFVSSFKNGNWTKLRKLNGNINTKYWESHAFISYDGKTLYFTSNRPGGSGELDIYMSRRISEDNWGIPVNLGTTINTRFNDDTPFLLPDEKTLYFSSLGHETMGGYDIFVSKLSNENIWEKPENIGYPINTTDDEIFFCPANNGQSGYMAKFDPNGYGKFDLCKFEIYSNIRPRIYINRGHIILTGDTSGVFPIYIAIYDKNKKDTVFRQRITQSNFNFNVPSGDYSLVVKAPGFKTETVDVKIHKGDKNINRNISINLMPLIDLQHSYAQDTYLSKGFIDNGKAFGKCGTKGRIWTKDNNKLNKETTLPNILSDKDKKDKTSRDSLRMAEIQKAALNQRKSTGSSTITNPKAIVPIYIRPGYYLLTAFIQIFI